MVERNGQAVKGIAGWLGYFVIVSILSYGLVNFLPARDERNLAYSYGVFTVLIVFVLFLAGRERVVRSGAKEVAA